jgi:hypothetical protein
MHATQDKQRLIILNEEDKMEGGTECKSKSILSILQDLLIKASSISDASLLDAP